MQTLVTSRGDVEAAFAKIVPSRVRKANEAWVAAYPPLTPFGGDGDDGASAGCYSDAVLGDCTKPRVHFPEALESTSCFEVEDDSLLRTPAIWSLGAGVSRHYREQLQLRAQEAGEKGTGGAETWTPFPLEYNPDAVWKVLAEGQAFLPPTRAWRADDASLPPQPPGSVRFVCVSDTHRRHRDLVLPDGDVLLHAGDFTMAGTMQQVADFATWLRSLPFDHKYVIAGNHDVTFDPNYYNEEGGLMRFNFVEDVSPEKARETFISNAGESVTYLEDVGAAYRGIRMYGAPWQPAFGNWAFQKQRGPPMAERWRQIPEGIDILLCHGPPLGRGDLCNHGGRAGCADLLAAVQGRVRPAFCVYGHIHEDAGISFDGTTHFLNAASVSSKYVVQHAPLVFDLPARDGIPGL